jgi:acyl dehydratase
MFIYARKCFTYIYIYIYIFLQVGTLKEDGPVVGAFAEVQHSFTQADVQTFSDICGDNNPIHLGS